MRPGHAVACIGALAALLTGATVEPGSGDAQAHLTRSLEVRCGPERCADLLEVRRRGTVIYPTPGGDQVVPIAIQARRGGSFRLETGSGAERLVRVLDGERATEALGDAEAKPLDGAARASLRRTFDADEAFMLPRALAGELRVTGLEAAGPGEAAGQLPEAQLVAVKLQGSDGAWLRLVLPPGGGLPMRLDYEVAGLQGLASSASEIYSDWRPVDGMLVPFEVTIWRAAAPVAVFKYEAVEVVRSPPDGRPAAGP